MHINLCAQCITVLKRTTFCAAYRVFEGGDEIVLPIKIFNTCRTSKFLRRISVLVPEKMVILNNCLGLLIISSCRFIPSINSARRAGPYEIDDSCYQTPDTARSPSKVLEDDIKQVRMDILTRIHPNTRLLEPSLPMQTFCKTSENSELVRRTFHRMPTGPPFG